MNYAPEVLLEVFDVDIPIQGSVPSVVVKLVFEAGGGATCRYGRDQPVTTRPEAIDTCRRALAAGLREAADQVERGSISIVTGEDLGRG